MTANEEHSLEDEFALFEQEISSLEVEKPVNGESKKAHAEPATTVVAGPVKPSQNGSGHSSQQPTLRHPPMTNSMGPPPAFLPHVMMRPGFLPPPNLAMPFMPNQLRLPMPPFMRPPMNMAPVPQATVLESGPSLYEVSKKAKAKDDSSSKESEAGPSSFKTQALSSDVELWAAKKTSDAANHASYMGQVLRGERKMKRFLRCGGGQVWEDNSLLEWDPNDFRIFCGDLGNEVSDELLAKAFRKYPSFQKAKVIRESRTNKSKGYGFVSFKHQDDFVRACREMDGKYVGNRPIKLRKSNWRERNMETVRKKHKQKQKLGLA